MTSRVDVTPDTRVGSHRWNEKSGRNLEYIKWGGVPEDIEYQRLRMGRSFFNRDDKKVTIFFWQSGAGGLFLSNCLALSPSVCSNFSTTQEKIDFWNKFLKDKGNFWKDLYIQNYCPEIFSHHPSDLDVEGYFFVYGHEDKDLPEHLHFWSNATVIYFKNPDLFCKIRKLLKNFKGTLGFMSYEPLMDTLKDYPIPISFSAFKKFPKKEQEEYKKAYECEYLVGATGAYTQGTRSLYVWDTNWFFSEAQTVNHVKEIYDMMGLEGFDKKLIGSFYRKWFNKLDKLSQEVPEKLKNMKTLLKNEKEYDNPVSQPIDLKNDSITLNSR